METCCREVLERSVIEKCWLSQHRQEMQINAQLFEYDLFRHLRILPGHPILSTPSTILKSEKILQKK